MPSGMARIVTLRGSNYCFLEQIFMVPKGFELSNLDYIYIYIYMHACVVVVIVCLFVSCHYSIVFIIIIFKYILQIKRPDELRPFKS